MVDVKVMKLIIFPHARNDQSCLYMLWKQIFPIIWKVINAKMYCSLASLLVGQGLNNIGIENYSISIINAQMFGTGHEA